MTRRVTVVLTVVRAVIRAVTRLGTVMRLGIMLPRKLASPNEAALTSPCLTREDTNDTMPPGSHTPRVPRQTGGDSETPCEAHADRGFTTS